MDSPRFGPESSRRITRRAGFSALFSARLAQLALAAVGLLGAAGCGGDKSLTTVDFRVVGPPAETGDGRCPELIAPSPVDLSGADRARFTFRRPGGGPFLCDVVLPLSGAARAVAIPGLADEPGPVVITVEYFGDFGTGPVLLGRGDTTGEPNTDRMIDIHVTPTGDFSCTDARPHTARAFHTVTTLPNGELLIAGGVGAAPGGDGTIDPTVAAGQLFALADLEIFDPVDGTVRTLSAPALTPRAMHEAVVLDDRADGLIRVALIGGLTVNGDPETLPVLRPGTAAEAFRLMPTADAVPAPTEVITYDPTRFTAAVERVGAVAGTGILPAAGAGGGSPVPSPPLLFGGYSDATLAAGATGFSAIDTASGAVSGSGAAVTARVGATVTPLGDSRTLVWSGAIFGALDAGSRAGEIISDDGSGPVSAAVALSMSGAGASPRAFHRAVQVGPGQVLVAGGFALSMMTAQAPASQLGQIIHVDTEVTVENLSAGAPATPVGYPSLVPLTGGGALLSGGSPAVGADGCLPGDTTGLGCAVASAYVYQLTSGGLAPTGEMRVPRYGHRGALLPDGRVVVTGGLHAGNTLELIPDAEIYDPRTVADDPLADLRPEVVRAPGDVARDWQSLDPVAECQVIDLP